MNGSGQVSEVSGQYFADSKIEQDVPQGYKQTEIGIMPKDWCVDSLGNLGKFKNGINKPARDFGFGFPFVNLMDVFGKPSICSDENLGLLNSTDLDRKEFSLINGDVLFIRSSVKPSGVGLTTVLTAELKDTVYSGFLIRFRSNSSLNNEFKKHCFYEKNFRNRVISGSTVSANTNINQDSLKEILIAYPESIQEQKSIASVLSDVDILISELEKLIAKKQAIKTATMQQLLTGRTRLPQFALREDGSKKGYKQSELGKIPEDWEVSTIGGISLVPMQNGLFYEPKRKGKGVPLINVGDMYTSAPIEPGCLELFDATPSEIKTFKAQNGDLFFTRSSIVPSGIAYCNIFEKDAVEAVFDSHLIRVRPDPELMDSRYLYLNCISLHARKFLISASKTATMTTIDQGAIKKCPVLVPPSEEQTAIATLISDMDNEIQALERRLAKTRKIKQGMMQELLTGKTRLIKPEQGAA